MIVQSYNGRRDQADLSFTVPRDKLAEALRVAEHLASVFHCKKVTNCPHIAKLSVSGVGLRTHTGVAIRMFRALSEAGINVDMINTSEVRVNVVVNGEHGRAARDHLQKAFADVLR
jgi:aspartate kinase